MDTRPFSGTSQATLRAREPDPLDYEVRAANQSGAAFTFAEAENSE